MNLRLLHFYPDLMSLYGSWANLAVLKRHLEDLGNIVAVEGIRPGDPLEFSDVDFVYMGAGTERSAAAALADFRRFGPEILLAAQRGVPMLFAGTAMSLLGKTITHADGETTAGIGLGDFSSRETSKRIVGDVYGETPLYAAPVVGFMNKSTLVSGVKTPLVTRLSLGFGNETQGGDEGFCSKRVFASHLSGPILVKNPALLEAVLAGIYELRGETLPTVGVYPYEAAGYAITAEQLRLRSEQG